MTKFIKLFCSLMLLVGCKNIPPTPILQEYKNKSIRTSKHASGATVFRFYNQRYIATFLNYRDSADLKKVIFGKLLGKAYGHNFEFDKKYKLNRYKFDVGDENHHSYEVYYRNNQYSEIGNPYVDYWKDESYASIDSTLYILYFSKFPRGKIQVFISNDSLSYRNLPLEESNIMPFLIQAKLILPNNRKNGIDIKIDAQQLVIQLDGLQDKKIFFSSQRFKD